MIRQADPAPGHARRWALAAQQPNPNLLQNRTRVSTRRTRVQSEGHICVNQIATRGGLPSARDSRPRSTCRRAVGLTRRCARPNVLRRSEGEVRCCARRLRFE